MSSAAVDVGTTDTDTLYSRSLVPVCSRVDGGIFGLLGVPDSGMPAYYRYVLLAGKSYHIIFIYFILSILKQ